VYVVFDDFRPVLPFYGHPEVIAPHLTALANKSMVFDRAYCNQAVCSPSRNSFMTGRRPNSTRAWNFYNSFREARCEHHVGRTLAGAPLVGSWTDPLSGQRPDPQQSGGWAQCCGSCTGMGAAACAGWSYSNFTCTLLGPPAPSSPLAAGPCPAADDSLGACVSGTAGRFPTWTTLPAAFKRNGFLTMGTGKLFHDGGGGWGAAAGPGLATSDALHQPGNGTPPNADYASWTNCSAQYPDLGSIFPPDQGGRWENSYQHAGNQTNYLVPAGAGSCPPTNRTKKGYVWFCTEDVPLDGAGASPPMLDHPVYVDAIAKLRYAKANRDATGQPFFLGVGIKRPHLPWRVPQGYADLYPTDPTDPRYDEGAFALPKHPTLDASIDPVAWTPFVDSPSPYVRAPDNFTRARRMGYYAAISWADFVAGQVFAEIEALGMSEDVLVLVHGDHGWHLGEKAMWEKRTVWELAVRIPFFVHVPWLPASHGRRTAALTELVDVMPSLLELLGVDAGGATAQDDFPLEGTSFAPLLREPDAFDGGRAGRTDGVDSVAGVKDFALSVYPRCPNATVNAGSPFADQCIHSVDRTQFDVMGYSLRTARWRYTEWVFWDGALLRPRWDGTGADLQQGVYARELYDHEGEPADGSNFDDWEVVNDFARVNASTPTTVAALARKLRQVAAERGPRT
jgi:arylsulfatase A-like enzyme